MSTPTKTVYVYEKQSDITKLSQGGLTFQIAKSVVDASGNLVYNVVWQSQKLAPHFSISWTTQYALNWTLTIPGSSVAIVAGGNWQPCNPGDSYDLDKNGEWVKSATTGTANVLNVGSNGYQDGIHILVGIQRGSTNFYDTVSSPFILSESSKGITESLVLDVS
jgi:hypothetical protein